MNPTTASVTGHAGDDFLQRQRGELTARRRSSGEQADRLAAAIDELADSGATPDLADDEGFAEADSIHFERDRVVRLETVPEATQCVDCASGSVLRRR